MIYAVIFLIAIVVSYTIDSSCYNMMKEVRKNNPKIKSKLEIPFYSIYDYYKWRKEIKNGEN